jgi:peptidyl-prolyl cis-trans isomerase C
MKISMFVLACSASALVATTALAEPRLIEPRYVSPSRGAQMVQEAERKAQQDAQQKHSESQKQAEELQQLAPAAGPAKTEPKPAPSEPATQAAPAPSTETAQAAASEPQKDYVIARVNNQPIMYSEVQAIWKNLFPSMGGEAPPLESFGDEVIGNIVRGMISERLMLGEAERLRLYDTPQFKEKMEAIRRQLLVQELLTQRNTELMNEANVKKAYEDIVRETAGKEEIRARHILTDTEKEAKLVIEKLKEGADFKDLAKQHSLDKGSAANGGDLGYFTEKQMVPEFAKAAFELDKGQISDPVKTSFGWHVIELLDRRQLPVPTLAEARPQLEKKVAEEANEHYIQGLLKDAKIEYLSPEGKPLPLPVAQQPMSNLPAN